MKSFLKTILLLITIFFISGCTSKHLTVKSLQPSLMHDKKIYNIILEEFENDRVNQANYLEEKLVNIMVDGKRVFNIKPTYQDIDAIVTGEVLESSLHYNVYYEEDIDYNRCLKYEYINGKRTKKCLRYRIKRIPCEQRNYKVKTEVQVLNKYEDIIFSKIYSKSKRVNQCFKNRHNYYPHYYNRSSIDINKNQINSQLAREIATNVISDISPHYIYQNITIMEELSEDNKDYTIENKQEFKNIVELLDNGNIDISQSKLHILSSKLNDNSYEVLYNLALTYEAKNSLKKAQDYYIEARAICNRIDDLKIIDNAINRTQKNLENKIKAKSQLN